MATGLRFTDYVYLNKHLDYDILTLESHHFIVSTDVDDIKRLLGVVRHSILGLPDRADKFKLSIRGQIFGVDLSPPDYPLKFLSNCSIPLVVSLKVQPSDNVRQVIITRHISSLALVVPMWLSSRHSRRSQLECLDMNATRMAAGFLLLLPISL